MFKRRKIEKGPTPEKIALERATFLVIDPADGTQQFEPEAGDFYVVEARGVQRAFLFEELTDPTRNCCDACVLSKEDSSYKEAVCPKFYCGVHNVTAREYVSREGEDFFRLAEASTWVKPPSGLIDEVESPVVDPEPIELAPDKLNEQPVALSNRSSIIPKTADEKRALWEASLRDLETAAQRADEEAADHKTQAKLAAKTAQEIRSKIFNMLWRGSENWEPDEPLFANLPDDDFDLDDDEEEDEK